MKRILAVTLLILLSMNMQAQDKAAYKIYDSKGGLVSYSEMLEKVSKKDVVFFGELHNNPIAHWLQYELTQDLFKEQDGQLILGAEMFERDDQLILNEYLSGMISQKNFEDEARIWPNYKTDYKPLVEFAKAHNLRFIATNVPRRYANLVFREGIEKLESLPKAAMAYLPPLPIEIDMELQAYKGMLEMMASHSKGNIKFPQAQAIKDATMAHSIAENMEKKYQFIHYNGSYHSDNYEGIPWYLNKYASKLSLTTIKTIEQEDISSLSEEQMNSADFIIVIPLSMTKTY